MPGTIPTLIAFSSFTAAMAMQDMPLPEKVTLITLFGIALTAMIALARTLGTRMAKSIDKSTDVASNLVGRLEKLIDHNEDFKKIIEQQQADHAREREKSLEAFAELRDTIRDAFQDRRRPRNL